MILQIYAGLALTAAESPDASVTGQQTTVLQKPGSHPNSGALANAHHFAGPVSTSTSCVIFAAVCIHADRLPKEASPIPEPADHLLECLSETCILINHEGESVCRLRTDSSHQPWSPL